MTNLGTKLILQSYAQEKIHLKIEQRSDFLGNVNFGSSVQKSHETH